MIGNIQLLRAAAAYAVVIHHADDPVSDYTGYDFASVSTSSGVDVFFVISGFVMVYTTYNRTKNPVEFWRDRAVRIVPMYWIATLCMISLFAIGFRPAGLHAYELQDVISSLFFIPDVRADGIEKPIIPLGWTLNYEMFFYAVFGAALFTARRDLGLALTVAGFLALAVAGFLYPGQNLYFRHVTNPILLEFVAGCLLATVYVRYRERITRRLWVPACAMIAAGVAALVVSEISGYDPYVAGSEAQRFLVYGIPALAIVSGAVMLEQIGIKATAPIILLQGAASYSIYLFHMFALQPAAKAVVTILPSAGPYGAFLAFAAAIGAAGVFGTLAHVLLEKPLGRQISAQLDRSAGWMGVRRAG